MATTRSSSSSRHYAGTLWVRVLRKVLGILKDTANTDACCCYRRLSWWTEHVPHDALPNEPRNVLRDTNEFNIDSLCFETHLFHSRELSSKRRWAIDSDGVVEISSVVKVVLLTTCFLVFAFCLTGCNSRWDLSLSENDSVLFGTCNQVQLSVYVYVFFFFPKAGFRLHSSFADIFRRTEHNVMVQKALFRNSPVRWPFKYDATHAHFEQIQTYNLRSV